jgi:hypothetical protein
MIKRIIILAIISTLSWNANGMRKRGRHPPKIIYDLGKSFRGSWTEQDDVKLVSLVSLSRERNGHILWNEVASEIPGKSENSCRTRFKYLEGKNGHSGIPEVGRLAFTKAGAMTLAGPITPGGRSYNWTPEEDAVLRHRENLSRGPDGSPDYEWVAEGIPYRSANACKIRSGRIKGLEGVGVQVVTGVFEDTQPPPLPSLQEFEASFSGGPLDFSDLTLPPSHPGSLFDEQEDRFSTFALEDLPFDWDVTGPFEKDGEE